MVRYDNIYFPIYSEVIIIHGIPIFVYFVDSIKPWYDNIQFPIYCNVIIIRGIPIFMYFVNSF